MTQVEFAEFLAESDILLSPQTCSKLVRGQITPGAYFKAVFKEITGIELVDGLIEK